MPTLRTILLLALATIVGAACTPAPSADGGTFRVDTIAEGVWLIGPDDPRDPQRTNSLVVEQAGGLVVIEAQPSPAAAKALIRTIAGLSRREIRFVVPSHPHAAAAGGLSAFPAAAVVVGSQTGLAAQDAPEFDFGGELRARSGDGWTAPPRRRPDIVVSSGLRLDDPTRPVMVYPVTRAYCAGNMIVELPEQGLTWLGAIAFEDANPYGASADVGNWLNMLNQTIREQPRLVVGQRGPALDLAALRRQRTALAWLRGQIDTAFVDRIAVGEIAARVMGQPEFVQHFPAAWDALSVRDLVDAALDEAIVARQKRGWEVPGLPETEP